MTANEYQVLAMKTLNKDLDEREVLINGVMGLCGESGEVIDIVKKHISQGHPLNKDKIVEELGDVLWYIAELATILNVTIEDIMKYNINKLSQRYEGGFTVEQSINRK